MNILDKIIAQKKLEVARDCADIGDDRLTKTVEDERVPLDFAAALRRGRALREGKKLSVIAEIKKASPSKGVIRQDFLPADIAQSYQRGGATALSVLTDTAFFQGTAEHFAQVRAATSLPMLRKDFILDERQVRQSYTMGADAILLIMACLQDTQVQHFQQLASSFGLSCLVEVHDKEELRRALALGCTLIGINNRNLKTFHTDLQVSLDLKMQMPPEITAISESGIATHADYQRLAAAGFDGLLIGESFMRQDDPGTALQRFLAG